MTEDEDRAAVAAVVGTFFEAFTSGPQAPRRLDALRAAFLPGAVVVRTCGDEPLLMSVEEFVGPREALLTGGSLVDFHEWEVSGRTDLYGDVAAHVCRYAKEGVQDGVPFTGRGMKTIQLVRTGAGWRISAAAWDDER